MAYGWSTTKTANGYTWRVHSTEWCEEAGRAKQTVLVGGVASTRARAVGAAKRHVRRYRRAAA